MPATFRAKARAVDLLGKGQIADLPTAISELWKNGYDAYADRLQCNLYLKGNQNLTSSLFTLSDDGFGMNLWDVENKWIVLGTDSKVKRQEELAEEDRLGKPRRVPMGEKGIGRLSVAYLGSKMLMLTKKRNYDCVGLFMDWQILENNNLFLDDVGIPIYELLTLDNLSEQFDTFKNDFKKNFSRGNWKEHAYLQNEINRSLDAITFPTFLQKEITENLSAIDSHGTYFIIFDPQEQLEQLNVEDKTDIKDESNYIRSSLSGIYNGFSATKNIQTNFWIHTTTGKRDLIASQNFFTEEDIFSGDHWVKGQFNSESFFDGEVQVFNQIIKHTFRPVRPPGKSSYGPFSIKFGTLEGNEKSSKLPPEKFQNFNNKLKKFGGLYIYRDQFRVLPYGRLESDFLQFEKRRNLGASYYFFSHRRMVGYIEITREDNPNLIDKAGREGFITNKAFSEFKADLIDFFIDLSTRYFRSVAEGETPTMRIEQMGDIQKKYAKLLESEKKKGKVTKKQFNDDLEKNSLELEKVVNQLKNDYEQLETENKNSVLLYDRIDILLKGIREKKLIIQGLKVNKPKRIELTKSQENKYLIYKERYTDTTILIANFDNIIDETQKKLSSENLKLEFENRLLFFKKDIGSSIKAYINRFDKAAEELSKALKAEQEIFERNFIEQVSQVIPSGRESKEDLSVKIGLLENMHTSVKEEIIERFDAFLKHIEQLSLDVDEDMLVDWYKNEYEKINKKIDEVNELSQLGMTIEIIDHQFNVLYSQMSSSIEFFKRLADKDPEISDSYKQLRNAFQHLETNHQLLTPLYRTTRRVKTNITGSEIIDYIKKFYKNQLEKYQVKLESNEEFKTFSFYSYESIIKPIFINLVNNALYWLIPAQERIIRILYLEDKVLIMNSGQKIEHAYLEDIFTLFFTRRPGGRGIGLSLARTNLRTVGYDIYATNDKKYNQLNGACFVIQPYDINKENSNL